MEYALTISYRGDSWSARLIKKAVFSSGYVVYLFERKQNNDKPVLGFDPYVVAVKSPLDRTVEFHRFKDCSKACQLYLDFLCCYA